MAWLLLHLNFIALSRYALRLKYDGSKHCGWQIQPNAPSIQGDLQQALSVLFKQNIEVVGCGRTDTGVHATDYIAHFDLDDSASIQTDKLRTQLNGILGPTIAIQNVIPVANNFHARFDATNRTYEYHIHFSKDPFLNNNSYLVFKPLDVNAMNEAANYLLHHTDFECFSKVHTDVSNFNCTITHAQFEVRGNRAIFTITANRFLRNMVRAIVGTLLEIGLGKHPISHMQTVLNSKNRSMAGASVPAHALYLTTINYPNLP